MDGQMDAKLEDTISPTDNNGSAEHNEVIEIPTWLSPGTYLHAGKLSIKKMRAYDLGRTSIYNVCVRMSNTDKKYTLGKVGHADQYGNQKYSVYPSVTTADILRELSGLPSSVSIRSVKSTCVQPSNKKPSVLVEAQIVVDAVMSQWYKCKHCGQLSDKMFDKKHRETNSCSEQTRHNLLTEQGYSQLFPHAIGNRSLTYTHISRIKKAFNLPTSIRLGQTTTWATEEVVKLIGAWGADEDATNDLVEYLKSKGVASTLNSIRANAGLCCKCSSPASLHYKFEVGSSIYDFCTDCANKALVAIDKFLGEGP